MQNMVADGDALAGDGRDTGLNPVVLRKDAFTAFF